MQNDSFSTATLALQHLIRAFSSQLQIQREKRHPNLDRKHSPRDRFEHIIYFDRFEHIGE